MNKDMTIAEKMGFLDKAAIAAMQSILINDKRSAYALTALSRCEGEYIASSSYSIAKAMLERKIEVEQMFAYDEERSQRQTTENETNK